MVAWLLEHPEHALSDSDTISSFDAISDSDSISETDEIMYSGSVTDVSVTNYIIHLVIQ